MEEATVQSTVQSIEVVFNLGQFYVLLACLGFIAAILTFILFSFYFHR